MEKIWLIWFAVAILFVIGEIFTTGFFLLWFGVGAAVSGVLALLGVGPIVQLAVFVVLSGILFASTRKLADRITGTQPPGVGADRFVNKSGVVIVEIDPKKNTGRVRVYYDEWRAESESGEIIPEGTPIFVTGIEGTHLIVQKREEE